MSASKALESDIQAYDRNWVARVYMIRPAGAVWVTMTGRQQLRPHRASRDAESEAAVLDQFQPGDKILTAPTFGDWLLHGDQLTPMSSSAQAIVLDPSNLTSLQAFIAARERPPGTEDVYGSAAGSSKPVAQQEPSAADPVEPQPRRSPAGTLVLVVIVGVVALAAVYRSRL